ncbi:MAG: cation:proton antiporter [Pseudomonadota bacterium]
MNISILGSMIGILFAALIIGVICRYLRFPTILGFLLIGAIAGPHAMGFIPNEKNITTLAEFGIVFLMFTIGLEFSLPKLIALKYWVFGVGELQVFVGTLVTTIMGIAIGMTPMAAFAVGGIVSMSSTAIVIKELSELGEINTKIGKNAVGILLAQDLAVIPFIILLASLSAVSHNNLATELLLALLNGIFAFSFIFFSRRWLLKPLFRIVSATRALDLFTILVLFVAMGTAWLTHWLGLSYALGAFLAGVMLSETEFRHQIEVEIRPFRDILLGLFFISIGMLVDITMWHSTWIWILMLVTAIVFCKTILITILCRLAGDNYPVSCRTGLILAQGGEFSFAILTFSLANKLLPPDYGQVVLAALWISIAISPLLIRYNKAIINFFLPKASQRNEILVKQEIAGLTRELTNHIILCGYGHVGQHMARLLEFENIAYIGLELDPKLVQHAKLLARPVTYGDASHPGILSAAGFFQARAMVICFSDLPAAMKIISIAKQIKASVPILVRCKNAEEIMQLKNQGATRVVAEVFEEGLALAHHLLQILKISDRRIASLIEEVRSSDYNLLRGTLAGTFSNVNDSQQLRPVLLQQGAFAINHHLNELNLQNINVEVVTIRRGKSEHLKPQKNLKLSEGDIIVLLGQENNLEQAEKILFAGVK